MELFPPANSKWMRGQPQLEFPSWTSHPFSHMDLPGAGPGIWQGMCRWWRQWPGQGWTGLLTGVSCFSAQTDCVEWTGRFRPRPWLPSATVFAPAPDIQWRLNGWNGMQCNGLHWNRINRAHPPSAVPSQSPRHPLPLPISGQFCTSASIFNFLTFGS